MIETKKVRKLPLIKKEYTLDDSRMWHYLAGNPAPPEATGLTRGIVSAGLSGLVAAIIIVLPLDDSVRVQILAALAPTITMFSYIAFGYFDRLLGKWTKSDD